MRIALKWVVGGEVLSIVNFIILNRQNTGEYWRGHTGLVISNSAGGDLIGSLARPAEGKTIKIEIEINLPPTITPNLASHLV